jgi:hypothetical protein
MQRFFYGVAKELVSNWTDSMSKPLNQNLQQIQTSCKYRWCITKKIKNLETVTSMNEVFVEIRYFQEMHNSKVTKWLRIVSSGRICCKQV